ncbi:MAG: 4-oxalocrotonate decarboxylase [Acidimicrobiaceae bacterium]|nr:4-oxalocrotonate decarboxylase [Acidimicrobiaceae bacterium]
MVDRLAAAESNRQPISPLTDYHPGLSVDEAYEVEDQLIERRISRGEKVVGAKVGLTSKAKQHRMGVDVPIFGWLTDAMQLSTEEPLQTDVLLHPRVEPEIAFVLSETLSGPEITAHDVLDATRWVCGGLEVIDSRYEDFRFRLPDVVADNTSAARFSLGNLRVPPDRLELDMLGVLLEHGSKIVASAAGAAVLGHPAAAAACLANHLGNRGRALEAGWVVLTGGLTDAVPLAAGSHVTATFAHLGTVAIHSCL